MSVSVAHLSPHERAALRAELQELRKKVPSYFMRCNINQDRFLAPYRDPHYQGRKAYPFVGINLSGNGVGKSTQLAQILCGITKGKETLNPAFYGDVTWFEQFEPARQSGKLHIRLTCSADDVKEGEGLHKAIMEVMPDAKFQDKESGGSFRNVKIGKIVVSIKTFNQSPKVHASGEVDVNLVNEPPPEEIWTEMVARTRQKRGENAKYIMMFMTPVHGSGWVSRVIEDSAHNWFIQGSIWENCCGDEIPEEKVEEIERRYGYKMPRDENGVPVTHGVLTADSIRNILSEIAKSEPAELDAREWGEFTQAAGSVYKAYSPAVHVRPAPLRLSDLRHCPVTQVVDPHPVRPPATAWFITLPGNYSRAIAEYPRVPYERMKPTRESVDHHTAEWRRIEEQLGITGQIQERRYGDPKGMALPAVDRRATLELKDLYSECGYDFITAGIPMDLKIRHESLSRMLYWDPNRPLEGENFPRLTFEATCRNCYVSVQKYGWKQLKYPEGAISNSEVDETHKDFADVVGFFSLVVEPYEEVGGYLDYDQDLIERAQHGVLG